jgi:hypothetical protein
MLLLHFGYDMGRIYAMTLCPFDIALIGTFPSPEARPCPAI